MRLNPAGVALCGAIQLHVNGSDDLDERECAALSPALVNVMHRYVSTGGKGGNIGSMSFTQMLATLQGETIRSTDDDEMFTPAAAAVLGIMQAIDSPDVLIDFFKDLGASLDRNEAVGTEATAVRSAATWSAAGSLLRRACLAFEMLSFEGVCSLFDAIEEEVCDCTPANLQLALSALPKQTPHANQHQRHSKGQPRSAGFAQETEALSKGFRALDVALEQQDFPAALDNLHWHFDATAESAAEPGRKQGRVQTALLSLAAVHLRFGHLEEALTSLNESVRRAQHEGDTACLTACLAQLCALFAAGGAFAVGSPLSAGDGQDPSHCQQARHQQQLRLLLHLCQRSATEQALPHLAAFAHLAAARASLVHGVSSSTSRRTAARPSSDSQTPKALLGTADVVANPGPSPTLQVLKAASEVHNLHMRVAAEIPIPNAQAEPQDDGQASNKQMTDVYGGTTPAFGPSLQGCEERVVASIREAAAGAHTLCAAAWHAAGRPDLAATAAATVVGCYSGTDSGSLENERALAYAQLATIAYERRGYGAALEVFRIAEKAMPSNSSPQLAAAQLCILHQRACHRRRPAEGAQYLQRLEALHQTCSSNGVAFAATIKAATVRQAISASCYAKAAAAASDMFVMCEESMLQAGCVQALQLQAAVQLAAGSPTESLAAALAAGHRAAALSADVVAAEATIAAAAARLAMGPQHAQHAQQVVQDVAAVQPLLSAYGSLQARADAQATLGAALLSAAPPGTAFDHADGARLLETLTEAAARYEDLEDFATSAKQFHLAAVVADAARQIPTRDAASAAFLRVTAAS